MHTQSGNTSKQRLHRLLSLLLAVVMVVGMFPAVVPSSRADSWATPYLDKMVGWGFMRADQAADHNRAMTRAEFMAVINRAYGYDQVGEIPFTDVRPSDWFYEDVCIAYNARYMAGTSETTASPNSTLTREQAVVILGHNMMLEEASGENLNFTDARSISDWSRGLVKTASDQYIINGYADGSFRPKSQVTRGEVAALVCNIIGTPIQEAGEHELGEVFGNVTITSAGVTLKNTTIAGDLYISGGVDLGNVELENVNVLGRIIIGGAGESEKGKASLILRNVQADEMLVDSLKDQYITMRVEGSTVIPEVTVKTPAYLEDNTPLDYGLKTITFDAEEESKLDLAGRIKEVVNLTPGSTIQVAKGTVEKMTVDEKARESQIVIDRGASVRELNLDTGTEVTGEGDIGSLNVNAPGSTTTMLPDKIYIRPGLTANIAGTVMDSTAAEEASRDPKILAGYPAAGDVAPTTVRVDVKTNKKGTVYWAITPLTDGSLSAEELINPPSYGSKAVQSGTISVTAADTLTSGNATGLVSDGTYYISAVLVDGQGKRSPVKVTAFTTPDNSVPAFNTGYPRMTQTKPDSSWVLVMPNKTCKLYYALYPAGAAAPTPDNLKSGSLSGNVGYGVMDVTKNVETSFQVNDRTLAEMKDYVLYLWLTDANGANSSAVVQLPFTTDDTTPPFFTTLPYVTQEGANNVNLSYELNENGTVYWAVVTPPSTPYPRPETGSTTVDLSSEYAKIQVKSGMHALARGESRFTVGQTGILNITGLQPQTAYELYFVAQDEQGNFSLSVQHMTIHTQDDQPPKVHMDFNRYTEIKDEEGNVIGKDPWVNTDIMLVFDEAIRSEFTGENFEDLYDKVKAAADKESEKIARQNLAKALAACIKMYYGNSVPEKEVPSITDVPDKYDPETDTWVLDYTQATVELDDETGEMIVTFPATGLHLTSGGTYYFRTEGITDTTSGANRMPNTKLDNFTIMFAQVALAFNDGVTTENGPFVRDSNGVASTTEKAALDYSFKMTPQTTENAEKNIFFDMLFFPSETMQFDLYARVTDTTNNADKTRDVFPEMRNSSGQLVATTQDSLKWVYLGNSGRTGANSSANLHGNAFFNYDAGKLPRLNDLKQDYLYEFVITVTYMQETADPGAWTGSVDMDVRLAAAYQTSIGNLRGGISMTRWTEFLQAPDLNRGGKSVGTPDDFSLPHTFYDYTIPQFSSMLPELHAEANRVRMVLRTTPPGNLYYVIAPVDVARDEDGNIIKDTTDSDYKYSPSIETTWDADSTHAHTKGGTIPMSAVPKTIGGFEGKTPVTAVGAQPGGDGSDGKGGVDPVNGHIQTPTSGQIQEPQRHFDPKNVIWNTESITTTNNNLEIVVDGLQPKTLYYVYFVMKSATGQQLSKVWVYQFETTDIENPQIRVGRDDPNAKFQIINNVPTYLDYVVYTTRELPDIFKETLADSSDSIGAYCKPKTPSSYQSMTLIKALTQRYVYNANDGVEFAGYNNYTIFDAFASDKLKQEVAAIIRQTSYDDNNLGKPRDSGSAELLKSFNLSQTLKNLQDDAQHYVIAVGHHEVVETMADYPIEKYDSFGAIDNVSKPNSRVPAYNGPTGETAFQATERKKDGTWSGSFVLQFDDYLYQAVIEDDPVLGEVQNIYKVNSSNSDDASVDSKSILNVMTKPSGITLQANGAGTSAAMNFPMSYSGARPGDIMTLLSEGTVSNSGGGTTGRRERLTMTFREEVTYEPAVDNDSGMVLPDQTRPVYRGYWVVTWG
ncbi:MAG: S-layer homology domain-containing protein [Oscillospiraceae bacterium]|nr:S-layer homology domain-containing protein [Oscillospiraceae bacterium]